MKKRQIPIRDLPLFFPKKPFRLFLVTMLANVS